MPIHLALRVASFVTVVVTQAPTRDYGYRVGLGHVVAIVLGVALVLAGLLLGKGKSHGNRISVPGFTISKHSTR